MRILIFGNSGSGKTTLARTLAATHRLAHLDLDSIVWEPRQIAVQRSSDAIAASLRHFLAEHEAWVIEGCYGELIEVASTHCTELIFLNPGLARCLANNQRRPWEPHKYASLEQQNTMLEALQAWVADYYTRTGPWSYEEHRRIFDSYTRSKLECADLEFSGCRDCPAAPQSGVADGQRTDDDGKDLRRLRAQDRGTD